MIFKQERHLHSPAANSQQCAPSKLTKAPSRALGGRCMRSAGMGGKTCVTLAIVLTTRRDRLSAASRSAVWTGVG